MGLGLAGQSDVSSCLGPALGDSGQGERGWSGRAPQRRWGAVRSGLVRFHVKSSRSTVCCA